jgi:hypothetical protein
MEMSVQLHASASLPRENHPRHLLNKEVGLTLEFVRTFLEKTEILCPAGYVTPDPPVRGLVATPTAQPRLRMGLKIEIFSSL